MDTGIWPRTVGDAIFRGKGPPFAMRVASCGGCASCRCACSRASERRRLKYSGAVLARFGQLRANSGQPRQKFDLEWEQFSTTSKPITSSKLHGVSSALIRRDFDVIPTFDISSNYVEARSSRGCEGNSVLQSEREGVLHKRNDSRSRRAWGRNIFAPLC